MDERIIDVDGNEIIISVDGVDDIEIADISFEDAEELEGDLIITAKYLNVEFGEVYPAEIVIEDGLFKEVIPIITDDDPTAGQCRYVVSHHGRSRQWHQVHRQGDAS